MNAEEVNIDSIVDYKSEYWAYIQKPHISGHTLTGLCPFHDDHNNSFSVDLDTGKWYCHTENMGGNFISFWSRIHGCDTHEAYEQILEKYGVSQDSFREETNRRSYTVTQYSFEKRLPEDWLKNDCKLETAKDRDGTTFMRIPYFGEDGREVTYRKRYAHKEFKWKYGSSGKIGLYGEWRLPAVRSVGYAVLVEGESDSQSLWYMGISALGIPGASMFKPKQASILQDLKLYIHQENDQGGETFLRKTVGGLREGGFIGEVYRFSCSNIPGCKDPSDVFMKFGKEDAATKIMNLIGKAEKIDLVEPEVIPETIKGAPVNLRNPEGWVLSEDGIGWIDKKTFTPSLVCRTPIILTQRLKSLDTGDEKIEVAFKRDGKWNKAIFPRSTIFTSRAVTVLADLGCTVTSENAKMVVRFLSALEAENVDVIPKVDATSTFGWQPGGRFIPGRDQGIVLDIDPSQKNMALAYTQNGSMEGWIQTMREHRNRNKFRFIMAAAFAAPLLRIVKQRIFFVYNWGGSKGGKTAALKAALSAWGDPERLMVNFNATQVGLERTAAFYCDLPLGIDERQLAGRNQESLEKIIYMIASGTGKIRGAKSGGIQAMQTWRTVAIATGEEPLSTETTQTGVSTRVLEIYGGPFDDEHSASLMHQKAPENCGWAGPEFVRRIVALKEEDICSRYDQMQEFVNSISDGRAGSHVAGVSVVALADAMIDSWFFSDNTYEDPEKLEIAPASWERAKAMARNILEEQMTETAGDVNENAVQFVVDWVNSNMAFFGEKAVGTCLGTMSEGGEYAYIFPSVLNQALERAGFSARKTLKYMADNGLITSIDRNDHKGKTYTIVKWFENRSCRFVEFAIGKLQKTRDPLEIDDGGAAETKSQPEQESFIDVPDNIDLPFD